MIRWKISADTGGTFTDCLAEGSDGSIRRGKVLSSGRLRSEVLDVKGEKTLRIQSLGLAETAWLEGKQAWIDGRPVGPVEHAEGDRIRLSGAVESVGPGSLVEIDSGLEAPVLAMRLLVPESLHPEPGSLSFRLGTTKGTNALLENKGAPVVLFVTHGFEDLLLIRDQKRPDLFAREIVREKPLYKKVCGVHGDIDAEGNVVQPLDCEELAGLAREALAAGCRGAAVCLLNSWRNPDLEEEALGVLEAAGFETVCLSSRVRPLIKYLDRTETTLVNTTLSPIMDAYLDRVQKGAGENPLWIMTSAGGLVSRARFHAVDSLVSGPAGGVLGAVEAGRQSGMEKIIALDMGGTSTDVSRWKARLELRQQIQVGQARILTPAMPIETVAAGGGSVCGYREGRLFVGPESAGADPGPAAYGAGGPLTLTDIHLLLGRIDPAGFNIPIRLEKARQALDPVLRESGEEDWQGLAEGLLLIATERMAHAIRQVTLRDGEDPAGYGLVAFGGAGGLHACRIADELGVTRIIFPPDAGILSARGIHYAPREAVPERQVFASLADAETFLDKEFREMEEQARESLAADGVRPGETDSPACSVFLRIRGQEAGVPVEWEPGAALRDLFREQFVATFGYFPRDPDLEVVKLRLRLVEQQPDPDREAYPGGGPAAGAEKEVRGFVEGREQAIPVFDRAALAPGRRMPGPAIIRDPFGTCFIEPGWSGVCGDRGSIELRPTRKRPEGKPADHLEQVRRTLVMNRLEGLVEEMGDQLRRTALSTNIRERLDFSCALLDREGRLLVNAPHIPVHLGAMGLCVRECLGQFDPAPGDVIITNHPGLGGSHLPDVTLLCGLFDGNGNRLGFLANRAHHAELGGRSPGSMPADATRLVEEGVILRPQWLIREGEDRFEAIEELLSAPPYPSRAVRENRIDLEAQLAALHRGRQMFAALTGDYGAETITAYFGAFYRSASEALTVALRRSGSLEGRGRAVLDDGHEIRVRIQGREGGLEVDFSGTSPVHPGNLNATPAIVRSAVLYVLRLFVDTPMPLNEGLLDSVRIRLPECFLNPRFPDDPKECPAVVGGNVETSQRIVDALVEAFGFLAAGQGTMNNLLFGNDRFGYYETIGGGSGAGDGFPGASGVHVHMTNTAITDPEILEQRFPVRCQEFSIRRNSGGSGRWEGGDGLVREIRFREPVSVSILSQNRRNGPSGRHGGGDGSPGSQYIIRNDGSRKPVPGITQLELKEGEGIRIETPGGGGWGRL